MEGLYLQPFPSTNPSSIIFIMMLSTAALDGAHTKILGLCLAASDNDKAARFPTTASNDSARVLHFTKIMIHLTDMERIEKSAKCGSLRKLKQY